MTKEEAKKIEDLQIFPNDIIEDCFYCKMAEAGRLSPEQGGKAKQRLKGIKNDPLYEGCMFVAGLMIKNLDRYGVPCIEWCK